VCEREIPIARQLSGRLARTGIPKLHRLASLELESASRIPPIGDQGDLALPPTAKNKQPASGCNGQQGRSAQTGTSSALTANSGCLGAVGGRLLLSLTSLNTRLIFVSVRSPHSARSHNAALSLPESTVTGH